VDAAENKLLRGVGRRLAELRRAAGMTQQELADAYGATPKYVRLVEGGSENLTLITMLRLARLVRADITDLLMPPATLRVTKGRPRQEPREAPSGARSRRTR